VPFLAELVPFLAKHRFSGLGAGPSRGCHQPSPIACRHLPPGDPSPATASRQGRAGPFPPPGAGGAPPTSPPFLVEPRGASWTSHSVTGAAKMAEPWPHAGPMWGSSSSPPSSALPPGPGAVMAVPIPPGAGDRGGVCRGVQPLPPPRAPAVLGGCSPFLWGLNSKIWGGFSLEQRGEGGPEHPRGQDLAGWFGGSPADTLCTRVCLLPPRTPGPAARVGVGKP